MDRDNLYVNGYTNREEKAFLATIKDVALAAKVSVATVSRVLNETGYVHEDTGTVRQGKMVSVYCDYNIYGLLREDYAGLQGING